MRTFWLTAKHYWRIYIIVALCTAVATGVLAGALIVGDSMRASLRNITLERLGNIQHALIADHFFNPNILNRDNSIPAILLNGTVVAAETETRASKVNIYGVDNSFFHLWEDSNVPIFDNKQDTPFAKIIINESLQKELNIQIGDSLLVTLPQAIDIHPEFLLGNRDISNLIQKLRVIVSNIIPTENAGRFSLHAHQSQPLNAYISLPILQKALTQVSKVNAVLTSDEDPITGEMLAISFEDLDLKLNEYSNHFDLQSRNFLIDPVLSEIALSVASEKDIPTLPSLTYLSNTISLENSNPTIDISNNTHVIPYSTIVALPINIGEFAKLVDDYTTTEEQIEVESKIRTNNLKNKNQEIILNEWAAVDLNATVGDKINITYYTVDSDEEYITQDTQFILKAILPIESIAADTNLIPNFPGIHDTADISEWEPPFPIDYTLIRNTDEEYWDEYSVTPKAFIPLDVGKQLWQNRFGDLTTIRMGTKPGHNITQTKEIFETEFIQKINPEVIGFQFLSLKRDGLNAAKGSTDFGMLFSSLSGFIIISVALLVGMIFRIGVENRSTEIGILQAVGYTIKKIRRQFLIEGFFIACIGSLIGCLLAVAYAQLMIYGLKTWWLPAIGTPFINLHVNPLSLLNGTVISLIVVFLSICITVSRLGKVKTVSLLTRRTGFFDFTTRAKLTFNQQLGYSIVIFLLIACIYLIGTMVGGNNLTDVWVLVILLLLIAVCAVIGLNNIHTSKDTSDLKQTPKKILIYITSFCITFIIGVLSAFIPIVDNISEIMSLLIGNSLFKFLTLTIIILSLGWVVFGRWLHSHTDSGRLNRTEFSIKNAARQPSRSITCVTTISLACCIIVAVGANRHDAPPESEYAFVAESALPLYHSLNTQIGRSELGFDDIESDILAASEVIPFRVLPGEDVSCLNLYQPQKPQILGATDLMLNKDPWKHLNQNNNNEGKINAIGDENSLRWILHHNPDEDFVIQDEFGRTLLLELDTVEKSLFQSQLIISESNFNRYFPSQNGYQFFLIKTPEELKTKTLSILEKTLEDYGFDVTEASERLESFRAVENTYVSTFQSLGGLGVLLGTFGLALVLFRNILERRGELATLRAFGFSRQLLAKMLFFESSFLLTIGLSIGVTAGIVATIGSQGNIPSSPWFSLGITLLFIFVFGIIANWIAVLLALRSPLMPSLKTD